MVRLTYIIIAICALLISGTAFAAVGDYIGSFDIAASGLSRGEGITWDGTHFWITDTIDDEVYKFNSDGTYASFSFDTAGAGAGDPNGIAWDGTHFWVIDNGSGGDEVYKFNSDGTYASFSFDTAGDGATAIEDLVYDGTYLWVSDATDDDVYQYELDGTFVTNIDISAPFVSFGGGAGLTWDGTYFWVSDHVDDEVYKYNSDWTYASDSFDLAGIGATQGEGIVYDGTSFFIVDRVDAEVYEFEAPACTNDIPWIGLTCGGGGDPVVEGSQVYINNGVLKIDNGTIIID